MGLYYVYVYRDPRTDAKEPIYVGEGKGNRMYHHLRASCQNCILKSKIAHMREIGLEPIIELCAENLTHAEACLLEKELIVKFGRIADSTGTLCNFTDGGEGTCGYLHSEETKALFSSQRKGKKQTEAQYAANLARKKSSESIEKSASALRGRKQSAELIEKRRLSLLGYKHSEETRNLWSIQRKGKKLSEDHVLQMRLSAHEKWNLIGQSFGHWSVIDRVWESKSTRYTCQCSCGVIRDVLAMNLRNGSSRSCGHK